MYKRQVLYYTYTNLDYLVVKAYFGNAALGMYQLAYTMVPVSYTHLRAHETVLDLVCRLLLAKKKYSLTQALYILI